VPEFTGQTAVATLELVVDEQPTADPATDLYHGKRREPLHPPVDGDVVDVDAAFGEQLFDVAEGQAKAQVPADRQHDHIRREATSGGKQKPAKADCAMGWGDAASSRIPQSGCSDPLTADATTPMDEPAPVGDGFVVGWGVACARLVGG
jgi:hypothetical protein